MILLVIALFAGILLLEMPGLVHKKYFKELAVFLALWSFAFLIAVLMTFKVNIPNPVGFMLRCLNLNMGLKHLDFNMYMAYLVK